jgi:hypothetical protein
MKTSDATRFVGAHFIGIVIMIVALGNVDLARPWSSYKKNLLVVLNHILSSLLRNIHLIFK